MFLDGPNEILIKKLSSTSYFGCTKQESENIKFPNVPKNNEIAAFEPYIRHFVWKIEEVESKEMGKITSKENG